ncbi:hypothetical protein Y032_0649g1114 [Ancylostoma ceylanicum]|nr:hypothetical protein Y032_0649g1114 [Ancylostoma ceylanicum]
MDAFYVLQHHYDQCCKGSCSGSTDEQLYDMTDQELLDAADQVLRSVCIDLLTSTGEYSTVDTFDLNPKNVSIDPLSLLNDFTQPSQPATWLCPLIDPHGKITDVVEYIRDAGEFGDATVSMSLNRSPAADSTNIRGSSSNVPFYPGGFDTAFGNVMAFTREEEGVNSEKEFFRSEDLLTCAPGMPRGLPFALSIPKSSAENVKPATDFTSTQEGIDFDSTDLFDLMDFVGGSAPLVVPMEKPVPDENQASPVSKDSSESTEPESAPAVEEIEAALESSLPKSAVKFAPPERYAYAKQLDPALCQGEYKALLPNMAKKYPFELDGFQQAAVVCMEKGESVFVAAHTSAGKTVVAEYAVALCEQHRTRLVSWVWGWAEHRLGAQHSGRRGITSYPKFMKYVCCVVLGEERCGS